MKHTLCYSTAALALLSAQAVGAQEWDLAVHGFFDQHIGYGQSDFDAAKNGIFYQGYNRHGDYNEAVSYTNAEIHFTPSIQLDNGLFFGVNVQLEGDNQSATDDGNNSYIDESYIIIKSDRYGEYQIGATNSAGYKMMIAAPNVTSMPVNSPSVSAYIPFSGVYTGGFRQAGLSSWTEVAGNNDMQRVTYYSPTFNGFKVGVSYAPQGDAADNEGAYNNFVFNRKEHLEDVFDIGASYTQSFNEFDVALAARWGRASWGKDIKKGRKYPRTYGFGAQFGYQDFTIGGSYAKNLNGGPRHAGDSQGWSLGGSYDMPGPWAFSATAYMGKADIGTRKQDYHAYTVGTSREIGPGVSFDLYGVYIRANNGYKRSSYYTHLKGYAMGSAINLTF